jgi:hypothetical protein
MKQQMSVPEPTVVAQEPLLMVTSATHHEADLCPSHCEGKQIQALLEPTDEDLSQEYTTPCVLKMQLELSSWEMVKTGIGSAAMVFLRE